MSKRHSKNLLQSYTLPLQAKLGRLESNERLVALITLANLYL